jgi:hypothetical protein
MCFSWFCILLNKCISCCTDCECSKEYCKSIPIKRYFLPIIGIVSLVAFEEFRDFIYFPLIVSAAFFVIFWNFPILVYVTASKPLYYEDLFIDEKKLPNYNVDPTIKNKFQSILGWVLIITNSILVGVLSDYWLYKTQDVDNYLEIIGVTGGIIKIFQVINNSIGRSMIKMLKRCIQKESKKFRKDQRDRIKKIVTLKQVESHDDIAGLGLMNIKTDKTIGENKNNIE